MKEYLIIGIAGVGKSSVVKELDKRGHLAYDVDDKSLGIGDWFDAHGQRQEYSRDPAWRASHQFLWDISILRRLIKERKENQPIYIAGTAMNVLDAFPLFERVVALDADVDTLYQRLTSPSRKSPYSFAYTDQHRLHLINFVPRFREDMQNRGIPLIKTESSIEQVVDTLISLVERS